MVTHVTRMLTSQSTLNNSMRGIKGNHPLAARTGITETTHEAEAYAHPDHDYIKIWDLPGAGTKAHPAESYWYENKLYCFDVLIFITAGRLLDHQLDLMKKVGQVAALGSSCVRRAGT
jgi:hypothetical protein